MTETDNLLKMLDKLHQMTDHLNLLLEQIEVDLNACTLGVTACVPIPELGTDKHLGYGKHDGKWGLLYISGDSRVSWANTSREFRVNATHHLPDLVCRLRDELESQTAKVKEATASVQDFLRTLEAAP